MAAPRFRSVVKEVLLPALAPHGFALRALPLHPVAFERTLRGHENSILLSRHPFDHERFSFQLMARKNPRGWENNQFSGGAEFWEYRTHEELVERLQQVREIILAHGLAWLDTYTPGNVPPWEELVEATAAPVLSAAGLVPAEVRVPDQATFVRNPHDVVVAIDLSLPGQIRVRLSQMKAPPTVERLSGGPWPYDGEAELGQALQAAREFLINRGIPWLNGEV